MSNDKPKNGTFADLLEEACGRIVADEAAEFLSRGGLAEQKQRIREMTAEIVELILQMNQQVPADLSRKAVDDTNDLIYHITMFELALDTAYKPDTAPRALRRPSEPR